MKIVIDKIPPSNNQFFGNSHNFNIYRRIKQEWHWLIKAALREKPKNPYDKSLVIVTYYFPDNRRRDIYDNYAPKLLLDPLVKEGIIVDDCYQHCKVETDAYVDKNNPRTEIEVIEIAPDEWPLKR